MKEWLKEHYWTPSPEDIVKEARFIESEVSDIGEMTIARLIGVAVEYRGNAYTPYFNYKVGASILTRDLEFFGGCNSESCAASPTNHAEGTAIAKAVSEGAAKKNRKFIKAIAVCAPGDSGPCGECLQRIVEHTDNCLIVVVGTKGEVRRVTSLKTIFPYNFNPSHLGK